MNLCQWLGMNRQPMPLPLHWKQHSKLSPQKFLGSKIPRSRTVLFNLFRDCPGLVADTAGAHHRYVTNQEDETLVGKGAWSELRLYDQYSDVWNATNCARLPKTCSVLRTIPSFSEVLPELESPDDRIPGVVSVFRLHPGSSLVPHTGPTAMRTTLHLGIEVPSGTEITVGGETRGWTVGRVLAFDDSFIHSVRNRNPTKPRTVLLANVWKRR